MGGSSFVPEELGRSLGWDIIRISLIFSLFPHVKSNRRLAEAGGAALTASRCGGKGGRGRRPHLVAIRRLALTNGYPK